MTSKKASGFHFGRRFFKPKLEKCDFCPNFSKQWPQKKERKRLHIDFGRYFFQIKAHQAIFRTLSHHFAPISTDFKAFYERKTFGGGIVPPAPHLPHQWCKLLAVWIKQKDVKVGRRSKHLVSHSILFLWQAPWCNFSIFFGFV